MTSLRCTVNSNFSVVGKVTFVDISHSRRCIIVLPVVSGWDQRIKARRPLYPDGKAAVRCRFDMTPSGRSMTKQVLPIVNSVVLIKYGYKSRAVGCGVPATSTCLLTA
jgi:hypothetical protein